MRYVVLWISVFFVCYLDAFSLDLERIKKHMDERFSQAKIETYPFPYLTIENILPEDLYLELVGNWPENRFDPTKPQSVLSIGAINQSQSPIYSIWSQFASLVVDQIIKKKVAELFREHAFERFGQHVGGKYLCSSKDLLDHRLVEERGPGISPHIDQGYIFAAMAIYFPHSADMEHTDLGTYFYLHNQGKTSSDVCFDKHVSPVKSAPYKPNTLSVWLQTDHSWHSGPTHFAYRDYVRKFHLTLIYLAPEFMKSRYGHMFNLSEGFLDESDLF